MSLIFFNDWDYSYSYSLVVINTIAVTNITSPLAFAIIDKIVINPDLNRNECKQKIINTKCQIREFPQFHFKCINVMIDKNNEPELVYGHAFDCYLVEV